MRKIDGGSVRDLLLRMGFVFERGRVAERPLPPRRPPPRPFPNEQAALKVLYLVATQKRKNRANMTAKTNGWKSILNAS